MEFEELDTNMQDGAEANDTDELNQLLSLDDDDQPEEDSIDGEESPQLGDQKPNDEPKFKVNYMGKEMEMSASELVTAAQKGLNYDRVHDQLEGLRSSREFTLLDKLARENGMTRAQYLDAIERADQTRQIQQEVAKGVPPEIAVRLHQLEQDAKSRRQQEQQRRAEETRHQQFADLAREYPDIKEFPPEVIQAVADGETPLNAYRAWENQQLKNKLKMAGQQKSAREKSPGSATGSQPGEEPDDFLTGFLSV
ncbi:hypothetical protein [Marasmitruncus massiliensis]|uniref:hypothetical protein n=1 Tax=Marasmitruncus massiliensis TaxID=1944642 RepID=UPI000C7BB86A|nr:hypothetical protein [Marasmitruncus massiliensis]